jgi:thymidylate kinase
MLIAVEGCDGFGKSTLINELSKRYPNAIVTKEPGSPHVETNKLLRELVLNNKDLVPLQRELLFYADAIGHKAFLESKKDQMILSDRGILTHYAYLYGYVKMKVLGADPDENWTRYKLCKDLIKATCAQPDAIIYLDGDIGLMKERRENSAKDAIESMPSEYFAYVLSHFDDLIEEEERKHLPVLRLQARHQIGHNLSRAICFLDTILLS